MSDAPAPRHPAEAFGATRVETPAGAYLFRSEPDSSPACMERWQRALAILEWPAEERQAGAAVVEGPFGAEPEEQD